MSDRHHILNFLYLRYRHSHAMIMGMSSEAGYEKLIAKVPLKEMSSYSTALSSLTGGRASFIMKFASYELVPSDVQDKLIKEFEAKQADE